VCNCKIFNHDITLTSTTQYMKFWFHNNIRGLSSRSGTRGVLKLSTVEPVLNGPVAVLQYLGSVWTGSSCRFPHLGVKNRTKPDLRTLNTNTLFKLLMCSFEATVTQDSIFQSQWAHHMACVAVQGCTTRYVSWYMSWDGPEFFILFGMSLIDYHLHISKGISMLKSACCWIGQVTTLICQSLST
jgi:hypothetical protein